MNILFISQLTGAAIVKAICWTLVHSLWQGLLLAIAGGLIVIITKMHRPSFRYNLLSALFLLFLITSVYTFREQLERSYPSHPSSPVTTSATTNHGAPDPSNYHYSFTPLVNSFTYYFDKHAPLVVIVWFIILSARLVRMLSGLTYINRIRSRQVHDPVYYWKNRLRELQVTLQISKPVQLLESGIIKVPMAVGWLKPMILIPTGLFTSLSSEQLEAILLHELAHIKRSDYLINLMQSLAETVFFFNPPVIWISSLIREERENCCDDIAIAITKSKAKFLSALVSFGEYSSAAYAMPFPGRKNQLLNRVRRIIHNSNNTLNSFEKAGMLSCCIFMMFLSAFVIPSQEKNPLLHRSSVIESKLNSWALTPLIKPEAVQPLLFAEQNNDSKTEEGSEAKSKINNYSDSFKRTEIKAAKIPGYYKPVIPIVDTTPKVYQHIYTTNANVSLNTNVNYTLRDSFRLNSEVKVNTNVHLNELKTKLEIIITNPIKISINTIYPDNADSSYFRQPYNPDSSYKTKPYKPTPRNNPLADPVIIDLIKENIIKESVIANKENFYYILNNIELIVQGVKQQEDLYRKMRTKYISPTGKTTRSYIWRN